MDNEKKIKVTISQELKDEFNKKREEGDKEINEFNDGIKKLSDGMEEFDAVYNEVREESDTNAELVTNLINSVEELTETDYDDVVDFVSTMRNEYSVKETESKLGDDE